ncbi:hypothetical protein P3X46_019807 [Hevea brasiliensis]|uniref:RING-type E3 ubiquitin transferase n=1 Tax=Hevea brasiliensis TaxID=3981 RepID=A0ABQ9LJU4_HEVBR|nr:hypothetical protein P3X46_019807 [Hevea brasiliensis]
MQGQDSTSNAFLGAFYLRYEPNSINLRWIQNNEVPTNAFVHQCHPAMVWMCHSSSSINNHNPVQLWDLLAEDDLPSNGMSNAMDQSSVSAQTLVRSQDLLTELPSSTVASTGIVQSLEERHSGSLITPFQLSVNMSPGNGQLTNRSAPLQQASSSIFPQNVDLNPTFDNHTINVNLNTVMSFLFKPSGSCIDQNPFANDHSNSSSLMISSGIVKYIVKENDGGEGCSLDGMRLYCKRKTPEDDGSFIDQNLFANDSSNSNCLVISSGIAKYIVEENDGGEGCSLDGRRLYYKRRAPEDEQLGIRLMLALETAPIMHQPSSVAVSGLGAGVGPSNIHQTIGVAGEAQHSQRNIPQHSQRTVNHQDFLPTNLATWTTRNSQPQLPAQLAIHLSFDCVPKTSSMTAIVQPTPPMQQPMPVSYSLESMQPFQWNDVTRSRTGLPLTSTYTLNGGDASLVEGTSRNTQRNGMLPSEFQRGYLDHMLRNLNVVPETNSTRNIAFNSRNSSTTHDHQSSAPIQQSSDYPGHKGDPIAARQRELLVRADNARLFDIPLRSGLIIQPERQNSAHPKVPVSSLTTAQIIGELLYEDLPIINYTVSHGLPEDSDLDEEIEDEMTKANYKNTTFIEIEELEELMIEYRRGLAGAVIEAHMKRQQYEANVVGSPLKDEKCCICQILGSRIRHYFHFDSIKQWLIQKNNYPISKRKALQV